MAGETTGGPLNTSAIRVPRNVRTYGVWLRATAAVSAGERDGVRIRTKYRLEQLADVEVDDHPHEREQKDESDLHHPFLDTVG